MQPRASVATTFIPKLEIGQRLRTKLATKAEGTTIRRGLLQAMTKLLRKPGTIPMNPGRSGFVL